MRFKTFIGELRGELLQNATLAQMLMHLQNFVIDHNNVNTRRQPGGVD